MPKIQANGIQLYYESHGSGEPLVLIAGLGADVFLWFRQTPVLSQSFQVIVFDNRGAGQSDKPLEPYSIRLFADDTAGLLQGLGIRRAHVLGGSLGGLIAQEFALAYPEMLHRLVLVSTTFGGPHSVKPSLLNMIPMLLTMRRTGHPEADVRRGFQMFTTSQWYQTHPDLVDQYVAWRVAHPQPPDAYKRQQGAVRPYNAEDRLAQITAPTLILHGRYDRLVPVKNAHLLAGKIPGAKLAILEAGHACMIEQDQQFNDTVTSFLKG